MAVHSSVLAWRIPWTSLVGYCPWGHKSPTGLSYLLHHHHQGQRIDLLSYLLAALSPMPRHVPQTWWMKVKSTQVVAKAESELVESLVKTQLAGSPFLIQQVWGEDGSNGSLTGSQEQLLLLVGDHILSYHRSASNQRGLEGQIGVTFQIRRKVHGKQNLEVIEAVAKRDI